MSTDVQHMKSAQPNQCELVLESAKSRNEPLMHQERYMDRLRKARKIQYPCAGWRRLDSVFRREFRTRGSYSYGMYREVAFTDFPVAIDEDSNLYVSEGRATTIIEEEGSRVKPFQWLLFVAVSVVLMLLYGVVTP